MLLFLFLFHSLTVCSSKNLTLNEINAKLKRIHEENVFREYWLTERFSELDVLINIKYLESLTDAKSDSESNSSPNNWRETILSNIKQIKENSKYLTSINDFQHYTNISSCFYLRQRVAMLDFELLKLGKVREALSFNKTFYFFTVDFNFRETNQESFNNFLDEISLKLSSIFREYSNHFDSITKEIEDLANFKKLLVEFQEIYCDWHCKENVVVMTYQSVIEELVAIVDKKSNESLNKFLNSNRMIYGASAVKFDMMRVKFISDEIEDNCFSKKHWKATNQTVQNCDDVFYRVKYLSIKKLCYEELRVDIEKVMRECNSTEFSEFTSFLYNSSRKFQRAISIMTKFAKAFCDCPFKEVEKNSSEDENPKWPCGEL